MSEYTPELVSDLREGYERVSGLPYDDRSRFVKDWGLANGFSPRSVVAKLSREGIYIPRESVSRQSAKKADIVAAIAAMLDTNPEALPGLDKAHKSTLGKILVALRG